MINNEKSFSTIMAFSAPKFIKDSYYIIASSYYFGSIKRFKIINNDTLVKRLDMVYDSNISIFLISKNFIELRVEKLGDSKVFLVYSVPSDLFFTKQSIKEIIFDNKNIHQCIFIFKDKDYGNIVADFNLYDIIISGGSNTKKHILSPIQLRLARFLIAYLPLTGFNVSNSFHSKREKKQAEFDFTSKNIKEEKAIYLAKLKEEKEREDSENSASSK
jgi:hypothetical protein